ACLKFLDDVCTEIDTCNPPILNVLKPLLVIAVVRRVKVEHVLPDHDKLVDSRIHHEVDHFAFEQHNVVINRIVPLSDQLDNGVSAVVIRKQYLQIQGVRAEIIPLRMQQKIVYLFIKLKLIVLRPIERRQLILSSDVIVSPAVIGLYLVHRLGLYFLQIC